MEKVSFHIKKGDIPIICFALVITALSFVPLFKRQKSNEILVITNGKNEYRYPLTTEQKIEISGEIGKSIIQIKDGCAFFADSDCANKVCVQSGKISVQGQWAACLPNGVFLRIEGGQTNSIDSLSY